MANRNQNYNPYAQNYLSQGQLVYEPSYDSTGLAEAVRSRQKRYDIGRQTSAEFQSEIGGMQTYGPDVLGEQVSGFGDRVRSMVDEQYGGDYGRAVNDITDMIAKERQNPAYKMIAFQNEQAELQQKAQMKDPSSFFTPMGNQDIRSEEALRAAIESGDPRSLQAEYYYRPDYETSAGKLVSRIKTQTTDKLFQGLSDEERGNLEAQLGAGNIGAIFVNKKVRSNIGALTDARDELVESFYNQHQTELEAEFGVEGARAKATEVIDNTIPQFRQYIEDKQVQDLTPKGGKEAEYSVQDRMSTVNKLTAIDENRISSLKSIKENNIKRVGSLNDPEYGKGRSDIAKKVAVTSDILAKKLEAGSENVKNFANEIPTFTKLYNDAGVDLPDWLNTANKIQGTVLTGGSLGLDAIKLMTKGAALGLKGAGKMYNAYAKSVTGVNTIEDSKNMIKEYETLYGKIPIPKVKNKKGEMIEDLDSKFEIVFDVLGNTSASQKSLVNLPQGTNESTGSKVRYNSKNLSANMFNRFTEFNIMKDGVTHTIRSKKALADELDVSIEELDNSYVSQYDPDTGYAIAKFNTDEGEPKQFQVADNEMRQTTGIASEISKDLKDKGYSIRYNSITGNNVLTVKTIQETATGKAIVPMTIELNPQLASQIKRGKSIEYYQAIINSPELRPNSDSFQNFSTRNYQLINR